MKGVLGNRMKMQIARIYSYFSFHKLCRIKPEVYLPSMCLSGGKAHTRFVTSRMNSDEYVWAPNAKDHLVWVDMELTSLDVTAGCILEVSCLITDSNLNIIAEGPDLVIHQPDDILKSMNEWCIKHHGMSGLTDASRNSKITTEEAEQQILNFLKIYIPPGKCPVAGNSVYMDRLFMQRYLPEVDKYLHYRIVDVSTIKELCRRWCPTVFAKTPRKILRHRSLSDIKESIKELDYYQSSFFKI